MVENAFPQTWTRRIVLRLARPAAKGEVRGGTGKDDRGTERDGYDGQCECEDEATDEAERRHDGRPASLAARERQRRSIRDRVVEEDRERAEPDGGPHVRDGHDGDHDRADGELSAVRNAVAGMHGREPVWKVAVVGHRERGPTYACEQGEKHPQRGDRGTDANDGRQ